MLRPAIITVLLLASVWAAAQAPVPGTFSTAPVQPNNGIVLTTPSMSLGNGISPTVVTNQASVLVEVPTSTVLVSAPVTAEASTAANPGTGGGGTVPYAGPSSGLAMSVTSDTRSLGEIAATLPHKRPVNGRVYTNEDINQLYARAENQPAEQQLAQNPQQAPPQRPHQYSVPVGSAPPGDVVPNEAPAQAGRRQRDIQKNPFHPKVEEALPNQQEGGQQVASAQIPKTASMLPLLGALGGAMFAAGLIYRSLRG